MRLIQLISASNRHPTGMTTVFAELRDRAIERGWSFEIMIPRRIDGAGWVEDFAGQGTVVHVLDDGGNRDLAAQISAVLAIEGGPVLIHTHLSAYDVPASLAVRDRPDAGLVWHVHSVLPEGRIPQARSRVKFGTFGRRVDRVVIPFENTRDDLIRRGVDPERLYVMPGCIDPDEYPPRTDEERRAERARMGVPEASRLLLHFGWHWHEKGGDLFLETVRQLVDEGLPVIGLTNRGGEPAGLGIERLGLGDTIEIGGLVEDSRPLYVAADCLVGPSRSEGLTFTYIEALATGLPIVATNLPGERILFDRVRAGVLATHDAASLAAGVRSVLDMPEEEARSVAAEAREWILETRTVERVAADLLSEYQRIMEGRGASV